MLSLQCCGLNRGHSSIREDIEKHPIKTLCGELAIIALVLLTAGVVIDNGFEYGTWSAEAIAVAITSLAVLVVYILGVLALALEHHIDVRRKGGN